MHVLALDTTTRAGSVALVEDDRIVIERGGDPARSHAERLPGEILMLLEEAGKSLAAIDVFAIAAGPGSFTGLRIGIATIQGLAFVQRRQVVAVSALEALAYAGSCSVAAGMRVGAWMDAYRREVFSALYQVAAAPLFSRERLVEIDPAAVGDPVLTLRRWGAALPVDVVIGDGAAAYSGVIGERTRCVAAPFLAGTIGLIAVDRARAGETIDPADVRPLYVRRPDAEIDRERKGARAAAERGPQRRNDN
jgi:tRNA threonylcarbamoyladenosine biosynthesis protein TsaB